MTVFGYIRFSYIGKNDTKIYRHNFKDHKLRFELLYNDPRMEARFYLFERLCLPSIQAQIDQDFKIIVLASNVMPEKYKLRLQSAIKHIPQIEILYSDEDRVANAFNPKIAELTKNLNKNTVHFRLDDDDAISIHTISILRDVAKNTKIHQLITMPKGLYLTKNENTPAILQKFHPYIAIAFAFVNLPNQIINPYECEHGTHYTEIPSLMLPNTFAYIHCAHDASDTYHAQQRKFKRALHYDPAYASDRGRRKNARIIRKNFSNFTFEGLEEIINNVPNTINTSSN